MMTLKRIFLTIALATAVVAPAYAYEVGTHRQMTVDATQKSVLYTDPSILLSVGLLRPGQQEFQYFLRTGNVRTGLGNFFVPGLTGEGSVDEDDGFRARHHFYDPVHDRAISSVAYRSWEWAIEDTPIDGVFVSQERSLRDARDFLTRGLTYREGTPLQSYVERNLALSRMLVSLGHTMHHIQDMAQPQHVRHDQHLKPFFNSAYEAYTLRHTNDPHIRTFMQQAAPVYPGPAEFKTARDFWFNSANTGIAQTVNRDFLSYGTNFLMTASGATTGDFALPVPEGSTDYTVAQAYARGGETVPPGIQSLCGIDGVDCTMTMYSTALSERASTYSVFDQDLRATGVDVIYNRADGYRFVTNRFFSLNRFNFDDVHPWVITRAVSYSAGIVNHFFRGKLEVKAPATGPYSLVDHSTGEGFRKVRVTVKNLTPGEALAGGSIRLIARYHRNACYKPDLTGEFYKNALGQLVTPCPNYRSPEPSISVSLEQVASFGADESKQMTFTLIDPIPLDATDLILQVYYTGQVGEEEQSFALGYVDVSEPTYMTAMNATDVFELYGAFYYWRDIVANIGTAPYSAADRNENGIYDPPDDVNVTGGNMSFEIYINNMKVADATGVPEGRFTRLAMIIDKTGFDHGIIGRSHLFTRSNVHHFPAKVMYYDFDLNTMMVFSAAFLRNHTLQFNSSTMYAYHPIPTASVATMPFSMMPNATIPAPVQLTPGVLLGLAPVSEWTNSVKMMDAMRAGAFSRMWQKDEPEPFAQPLPVPASMTIIDVND